ncbi:hypothetical protein [uncultured Pontibacter sp.]|uniref:hypothetical protein n=1 Tax=uncultured Pontibacter sp. TaxID=453356 RepID=UPI00260E2F4C|nr:hypothetical protein [uncultured Pontibacter sp.]
MKKFSHILYGLLLFALLSCKKEEIIAAEANSASASRALIGTWYQEAGPYGALRLKREYSFKTDNSFDRYEKVINSSGDVVGFRQRATGKYELKGDKLTMVYLQFYNSDKSKDIDSYEEEIDDLIPSGSIDYQETVTLEYHQMKNIMMFKYPPCPFDHSCIGNVILFKA